MFLIALTLKPPVSIIFVFVHFHYYISYQLLNILKIKRDTISKKLKIVYLHLSSLNNFHSLEVVDRVSETQLQVGENYN